jgi:hypothetical protein
MSFFDKVRAATEQAAARAKEEMQLLAARRELSAAYGELGRTAFDLADKGELVNSGLDEVIQRVRTLKAELAAMESHAPAAPTEEETEPATPAEPPSAPE